MCESGNGNPVISTIQSTGNTRVSNSVQAGLVDHNIPNEFVDRLYHRAESGREQITEYRISRTCTDA